MHTYYKAVGCACGCGEEVAPKTPGRPARFIHGHNRSTQGRRVSVHDRFWSRVHKSEGCWEWTGGHDKDGRGRFWHEGRNVTAPRMALLLSGTSVQNESWVCHHCDNPSCVRPSHLYVGDATTNVRDMDSRGRRVSAKTRPKAKGEKNHNAKLSDADVAAILSAYTGKRGEQTKLAAEYGVTPSLINAIIQGGHRNA